MTRKKKTRSLKNIHNVKTGNIAKLKRAAGSDRQKTKRLKGRRTPSVFEKYLDENQQAKQAHVNDGIAAANKAQQRQIAPAAELMPAPPAADTSKKETRVEAKKEPRQESPTDLLDQLDSSSFKDIY